MRGRIAEDQDFTGVANRGFGAAARVAARRTLGAAFAAGGRKQGDAKPAHAGQDSSSRELWGSHRLDPFTAEAAVRPGMRLIGSNP